MGFLSLKSFKIILTMLAILGVEGYFIVAVAPTSAYHNPPNSGSCNNVILVTTSENPACDASSQVNPSMTSYSATYHVQSLTATPYTLQWNKESWYCTNPFPHEGNDPGRLACRESVITNAENTYLLGKSSVDITVPGHFDQPACGSLQTDLSFSVLDNNNHVVCNYGNPNFVYGFSFCSTGKTCGAPRPTSTPKIKPSVTPTPTCTPTPHVSASPTATPTMKITATPTATGLPSPTPTSIPAAAAAATPTPTAQNIVINVSQSQSQSQSIQQTQQVLTSATVAPAPTSSQLPSTGAGSDILFGLGSLLPIGLKLRKWKK